MIFTTKSGDFKESYKERNLYAKIFGGLIFNELIPDNNLPEKFMVKLGKQYEWTCEKFGIDEKKEDREKVKELIDELIEDARNQNLTVSFDYHINREVKADKKIPRCDVGEMADIFIGGTKSFVAIEAKFEMDYGHAKDIVKNGDRISEFMKYKNRDKIQVENAFQVLLITEKKFTNLKRMQNHPGSNYNKLKIFLKTDKRNPFILIFWEDILDIIPKGAPFNEAYEYLEDRLK